MKLVLRLSVPLPVIGPPVSPGPLPTLVTVPPRLGAELVNVMVPPNATVPPPDNPDPAVTVTELFASIVLVTPADGMLIVPLLVIGPPVNPAPVFTLVTVPLPDPGNVWPDAKLIRPLLAIDNPVSPGVLPLEPNNRFNVPDGFDVSLPVGSACQRKSWLTADELVLLNDDACRSNGLETKPFDAVAVPVPGNSAPAAETAPLNAPVNAERPPLKVPVVPVKPPVNVPPESCR